MTSCSPLCSALTTSFLSPISSIDSCSVSIPAPCYLPLSPPSKKTSKVNVTSKREPSQDDIADPAPGTKRRKVTKPREMKTEYLDLISLNSSTDEALHKMQDAKLKKLLEVFRTKRKIVVFAGAGISVSAGIPDFRSSSGLFQTLRADYKLKASGKQLFDADVYRSNDATSSFHAMVRELSRKVRNVKPTPFHDMLATLAEEGRLMRLYTQNVDGIDVRIQPLATNVPLNVKGPWPKAIQLHGGLGKMVCSKCGHLSEFDPALFEGPVAPPCPECEEKEGVREAAGLRSHGIGRLRPRILLYNEHNPDEDAIGAVSFADITKGPDAVIVVGTSLQVPGIRRLAKEMCLKTRARRNGFTAWINCDPEPAGVDIKDCWDMVVRAESDDIARIVGLPKWDDKDYGDYSILNKEMASLANNNCHVVLNSKLNSFHQEKLIPSGNSPNQINGSESTVDSMGRKVSHSVVNFGLVNGTHTAVKQKKSGRKPLPSKATKPTQKITNKFNLTKISRSFDHPTDPSQKSSATLPDVDFQAVRIV